MFNYNLANDKMNLFVVYAENVDSNTYIICYYYDKKKAERYINYLNVNPLKGLEPCYCWNYKYQEVPLGSVLF